MPRLVLPLFTANSENILWTAWMISEETTWMYFITGRNEVVAKVMFLQASVIPSTSGGGLPQCMLGYHTPQEQTSSLGADPPSRHSLPGSRHPQSRHTPPWEQTPPEQTHTPLGADTPPEQTHPLQQTPPQHTHTQHTPPAAYTPWPDTTPPPPPQEAGSSIRSMSSRYASYWNAFLLWIPVQHIGINVKGH